MDDTLPDFAPPARGATAAPHNESLDALRSHSSVAVLSLKQAMRRARFDDAERSGAVADLRAARLGRLEVLREALAPLLAQIPEEVDCFDVGIMPGSTPRLFIDMIGYVEMGRDPRVYCFLQDTRHNRVKLAEGESVEAMVEAVTHYVARRLLERDKALATDGTADVSARPTRTREATRAGGKGPAPKRREPVVAPRWSVTRVLGASFAFLIDVLGAIAFFSLVAFALWVLWANVRH